MANGYGRKQVFATNAGKSLAEKVCSLLSIELGQARVGRFNDGEIDVQILQNIRGDDLFIIGDTSAPADNLMELVHLIDAARGSSAGRITAVIPYMGYARSDRKDQPRKAVGIRIAFGFLELVRPDRYILLDIHAEQSLACINNGIPDHLYGSAIGVPHIRSMLQNKTNFVVASPDRGGVPRALKYANLLGQDDVVIFSKERLRPGEIKKSSVRIIGEVAKKTVILVDDMIDSGGTVIADAEAAKKAGAKKVWMFATHGIFSRNALVRIEESAIDRVFVTDSVYHDPITLAEQTQKVEILSCASLLAQAIDRTHEGRSLSELIP